MNSAAPPRPSFGMAKPMASPAANAKPISSVGPTTPPPLDAMARLAEREAAIHDTTHPADGFEASVHRIKEQVLPRLLERIDPEAAAALTKDELSEEFRPITSEVLAELKLNLNRREQFALEKLLVDELLGLGPLEELLSDPDISDIMVNGPLQTYVERKSRDGGGMSLSATGRMQAKRRREI